MRLLIHTQPRFVILIQYENMRAALVGLHATLERATVTTEYCLLQLSLIYYLTHHGCVSCPGCQKSMSLIRRQAVSDGLHLVSHIHCHCQLLKSELVSDPLISGLSHSGSTAESESQSVSINVTQSVAVSFSVNSYGVMVIPCITRPLHSTLIIKILLTTCLQQFSIVCETGSSRGTLFRDCNPCRKERSIRSDSFVAKFSKVTYQFNVHTGWSILHF